MFTVELKVYIWPAVEQIQYTLSTQCSFFLIVMFIFLCSFKE